MYTLVGFPKTRAFRVLWMLEELGLPYDVVPAAPRSAEAKAVNPSGKVPALKVGDDVIIDSVAICQFLADSQNNLTKSAGTIERAQQDSWTQFAMDDIELPLWVNAKHDFILPENLRSTKAQEACAFEFKNAIAAFADRLGSKRFVMGNDFTVPDLLLGHCGKWAQNGPGWELPAGPVADYFARVVDRPAYQRADEVRNSFG